MNSELACKLLELNDLIKETDVYKDLVAAEKKMEESDEVAVLSYKKDMIIVELEDALKHYGKNSSEVLKIEKNLADLTYFLNNHDLVKDYKTKLDALNTLYSEIENHLFKGLKD